MKKTFLALAAVALSLAGAAHAESSHYFAGATLGVGHVGQAGHIDDKYKASGEVFGGYRINSTYALEASTGVFERADTRFGPGRPYYISVAATAQVPVAPKLAAYVKLGEAYSTVSGSTDSTKWVPVSAVGGIYSLTSKVDLRAEVKYFHNFADTGANVVDTSIGASYKF